MPEKNSLAEATETDDKQKQSQPRIGDSMVTGINNNFNQSLVEAAVW